MERQTDSCVEILDRLSPVLPAVFNAYRVPPPRAREIVDEACRTLLAKSRLRHQDPDGWLLRTIIESCRGGGRRSSVKIHPNDDVLEDSCCRSTTGTGRSCGTWACASTAVRGSITCRGPSFRG